MRHLDTNIVIAYLTGARGLVDMKNKNETRRARIWVVEGD